MEEGDRIHAAYLTNWAVNAPEDLVKAAQTYERRLLISANGDRHIPQSVQDALESIKASRTRTDPPTN